MESFNLFSEVENGDAIVFTTNGVVKARENGDLFLVMGKGIAFEVKKK